MTLQANVTYNFKLVVWASTSYGISRLGETVVNGIDKNDPQNSSRLGLTFAHRLSKQGSVKLAYSSGVTARYAADINTYLIAFPFM